MTAEEWACAYAARHGLDPKGLRVRACACGLPGCEGWEVDWSAAEADDAEGIP